MRAKEATEIINKYLGIDGIPSREQILDVSSKTGIDARLINTYYMNPAGYLKQSTQNGLKRLSEPAPVVLQDLFESRSIVTHEGIYNMLIEIVQQIANLDEKIDGRKF